MTLMFHRKYEFCVILYDSTYCLQENKPTRPPTNQLTALLFTYILQHEYCYMLRPKLYSINQPPFQTLITTIR